MSFLVKHPGADPDLLRVSFSEYCYSLLTIALFENVVKDETLSKCHVEYCSWNTIKCEKQPFRRQTDRHFAVPVFRGSGLF